MEFFDEIWLKVGEHEYIKNLHFWNKIWKKKKKKSV